MRGDGNHQGGGSGGDKVRLGMYFIIESREFVDGLDGRCQEKGGAKDSPWSWARPVV